VLRIALFAALLIGSCGYALWRGGTPERIVGAAMLGAFATTLLSYAGLAERFTQVEYDILVIDLLLMAVLAAVALRADRGWPILLAGLHLATLGAHAIRLFEPEMIRVTYAVMIAFWSYPMVLGLAIGTRRHRRRVSSDGGDRAWSERSPRRECAVVPESQNGEP
jgi:uncharacterized membrane protein YfcA